MEELHQRLSRLDACVVSDAMDRLGLAGVALGITRLSTKTKIAGPVLTVKLEESKGRLPERPLNTAAIEAAQPGDVIVVEHHDRADCSGWGGILCRAARVKQVAAVIVDGMCRDIDEAREIGFPVFARGAVPAAPRGRVIETAFNVPVTIGSVNVRPADWVVADGSGVVFIPTERLAAVIEEAEKLVAREAGLVAEIESGTPVGAAMSRTYQHLAKKKM